MKVTDAAITYFCWALIFDAVLLICVSFFRASRVAVLWTWLGATLVAYLCYEAVMPDRMNIRVDLLYLYPLFLLAALACGVRSFLVLRHESRND